MPLDLNRTHIVLTYGPTLKSFEERIEEFRDVDAVYCTTNRYHKIEHIIQKIDRTFDILYVSSRLLCQRQRMEIDRFKGRGNNLFVGLDASSDGVYCDKDNPAHGRLNTLSALLLFLVNGGVKRIFLFGADGKKGFYNNIDKGNPQMSAEGIMRDADSMNSEFWNKTCVRDANIYNVSPRSQIKCFKRINLGKALKMLKE